jgi:hypothetical protein
MLDTRVDPNIAECTDLEPKLVSGCCSLSELRGRRVRRFERFSSRHAYSLWKIQDED